MGARFGDAERPLLVSVRSGARASMPGHDGHGAEPRPQRRAPCEGLARQRRRALRLRQLPPLHPDVRRRRARRARTSASSTGSRRLQGEPRRRSSTRELAAADWRERRARVPARSCEEHTGAAVPAGSRSEQLWGAIGAVFRSWDNERARRATGSMHGIPERLGHRGQRAGDGVRQHGRRLRHRRRLHARPVDRRAASSTAST